eukprot:353843-Chlamydomonas_euryale.AAC.9
MRMRATGGLQCACALSAGSAGAANGSLAAPGLKRISRRKRSAEPTGTALFSYILWGGSGMLGCCCCYWTAPTAHVQAVEVASGLVAGATRAAVCANGRLVVVTRVRV